MKNMQREIFVFNQENLAKAKEIIARYPEGRERSAILPLLDMAQRQNSGQNSAQNSGSLSVGAIEYVANMINIPVMKAMEVASFYSMFNLKPVGKFHIQVCGTTPCSLRGAGDIISACKKKLGIDLNQTTEDGMFTLSEVECLGACVNAPMAQINDDYHENLTPDSIARIIDEFRSISTKSTLLDTSPRDSFKKI